MFVQEEKRYVQNSEMSLCLSLIHIQMCIRDRQIGEEIGVVIQAQNERIFDIMPVSYTHLDVYKRQQEELLQELENI